MSGRLRLVGTLLIVLVLSLLVVVGVASAAGTFTDDDGNIHEGGIEEIAAAGITKGCNPPVNDRYCPSSSLTRGQMAAFLRRALDLPSSPVDYFADDDDSVFEGDINALAEAGITKGCNPPAGDRYCPDGNITRGQMAAFLRRAFNYPASPVDYFTDDDASIFEADINAIAQAGVTKGCNPPDNDRYCPTKLVKRDQMASFFARALALPPPGTTPGVNEIDPEKTLLPDAGDVVFHTLDNEGESHLTFDGKVDVGDVIVMGITPETPEGFLGKATRVSGDQVTTEPASLMDAIPVADFTAVVPVDPTHAITTGSGDADLFAAQSLGFSCGGQSVTVDVDPEFESGSMIFEAKWGWTGLRNFEAGWQDLNVSGDVSVTAAVGFGCTVSLPIVHKPLPPIAFTIGPVPVVIVPTATIDLGFTAAASGGITVSGDFDAGFGGGLIYEGGDWRSYTDPTYTGHAFAPVLGAGGSLTVDVLAGLRGDIYGVGGPSVDIGPFVDVAANTSLDPWWTIDGGISAGMGVSTNGWLIDLSYELFRIRLLTWRLAQATTDPPPRPWLGCGSQTSIPRSECDALVTIHSAMGGTGWGVEPGWLTNADPCSWYGVYCTVGNGLDGHNVTDLFIDNVGATGPIPSEIENLPELQLLMLRRNPLVVGPIPAELGNLRNLYILGLDTNSIAGTIPAWLGHMNLDQLWLHGNEFSGEVPVELMNLTHLADVQGLSLYGQSGCLTAANTALSSWLASYDPRWNDGCPGL